jgi:D-alanyl-D-alanine carboxypeptidase/D-alanyl-D-alanine-endopeptidase (penicillin-binding protein 4)
LVAVLVAPVVAALTVPGALGPRPEGPGGAVTRREGPHRGAPLALPLAAGDQSPEPLVAAPPADASATAAAIPLLAPSLPSPNVPAAVPSSPAPQSALAPPPALVSAIESRLADSPLGEATVGLSVWLEGFGEVVAHNADVALVPASNQKLYTAVAALSLLPPGTTLRTEVRATGSVEGGILLGDLVLVGGGDPTLRRSGPHSLDDLAAAVRAAGIEQVAGQVLGDASRYDAVRAAPGWRPGYFPTYIGPLSALVLDRNHYRRDAEFLADPLPGNVALFRKALSRQGVRVLGADGTGRAPVTARVVASLFSEPVEALVARMLTTSDNLVAELLLKEVGWSAEGKGSTATGIAAADEVLRTLGVDGSSADGSGLSLGNLRSARQWRLLLQAARGLPFGQQFADSLPLGGQTGTLWRRLGGTAGEGNVRAKTGAIAGVRALSGYLTTAGNRPAVFSIIVNGTHVGPAVTRAIDGLVATIAADGS